MNTLEKLFPESPSYRGVWYPIYLEPIVGSGEKVTVAVIASSLNNEYKIVQAIRNELLECLYGEKATDFQSMIEWVIESLRSYVKAHESVDGWVSPLDGVVIGNAVDGCDEDINGLLRQAIRFSASLSTIALDAEREEDSILPRKQTDRWATSIYEEARVLNPNLVPFFKQKIQIGEAQAFTSFGFLSQDYASNFGLLVPSRLGNSLTTVKAKLLDLETLKKSNVLIKPETFELIIGTPSVADPTLTDKAVNNLKASLEMLDEVASSEGVTVFRAADAKMAAEHIVDMTFNPPPDSAPLVARH